MLAKGTSMSEQKLSFMAQLDQWTEENVVFPLSLAMTNGNEETFAAADQAVRKAIRAKVLESYRNGQSAGPREFKRP
jgi:hypothetical protein